MNENEKADSGGGGTAQRPHTWCDLKDELGIGAAAEGRAAYDRARRLYELGLQVRTLRRQKGLTQTALAERARTNQAAIARIEAGGPEPRLSTLERIGEALGVDLVVTFREREQIPFQHA